ncbi:hypothetical protein Peur_070878 [Populus x canadensis]
MDTALLQDSQEQTIHQNYESETVERLFRVLMITKDLGLPNNSEKIFTKKKKKKPKGEGEGEGMFSLSLKCKTATVALREGYKLTWKISKSTSSLSSKR